MTNYYQKLADLPLKIDSFSLAGLERPVSDEWTRYTTVISFSGDGCTGLGEDVTYAEEDQKYFQEKTGSSLELAGTWTLDSFSRHVGELDTFAYAAPDMDVFRNYRRWALESAALDLALQQAKLPLHKALGITPGAIHFVASPRLGDPPSFEVISNRLATYPWLKFKLDAQPSWSDALLNELAESGSVAIIDLKGAYKGTIVDNPADPDLYERVARILPDAIIEDPDLGVADAAAALANYKDRISWDAVIHSVAEIEALEFAPKVINIKPSRFGSVSELFATYEYCHNNSISMYGGGQLELGPGRGQIQYLAALFHADAPNDIAPSGYDWVDFPRDLQPSPLDPQFQATGFQR
jgi:L-alanine-DL-glutamate epimerase-like enolase superfamily enzyme